jgi:hypothetical protein
MSNQALKRLKREPWTAVDAHFDGAMEAVFLIHIH